jgi:Putative peptidoglycan binding domain
VRKVSVAERLVDGIGEMHRALVRVRLPRIFGLVLRNPRDSMCALALMTAVAAIVANSLYLQPGRHPAPIFAIRPLPVLSSEEGAGTQLPRRRPPPPDAQKPESTQKGDPVPLPRPRAQSAPAGSRPDLSADAANPLRQLSAVQRILNEFGYGPIRVSGVLDDNTREGIARFERDHNLPITGQNTPRLRHALSMATGRSLE